MVIKIKNLDINYIRYGSSKRNIILLHGWGQNIEMMKPIGDKLSEEFNVTIIDFPGFGESDRLYELWTISDYVEMLHEFVHKLKIDNPILIGHSFGGRVAIKYSSIYDVEKVVLFGAPCIRENKKSIKEEILKKIKKLPGLKKLGDYAKKYIGSEDYRNASPIMRDTLVKVVNEDLSMDAKKIKKPVLLIWGTNDEAAPIEDARKLEAILEDGGLVELPGCTHYAYLEALPQVINILKTFL
ncbi:MAG: alpha/beta hydrolase [Bacilli bacterium]|nr:alpha/beta hydrolase [Bacilli bacterium]